MTALAWQVATSLVLAPATTNGDIGAEPAALIERGVVVRLSPRPPFGSGIFAVWADLDVEDSEGTRRRLYFLYFGEDQFLPPVNSVCRMELGRARIRGLSGGGSLDGTRLIDTLDAFSCDTGSDAPGYR